MNKVILTGRLTADPDIRYSNQDNLVARYCIAVDKGFEDSNGNTADFINCVTFGKSAEFVEKYLFKGMKILIEGKLNAYKYENDSGETIYRTDVIVLSHEFCEPKKDNETTKTKSKKKGGSKK